MLGTGLCASPRPFPYQLRDFGPTAELTLAPIYCLLGRRRRLLYRAAGAFIGQMRGRSSSWPGLSASGEGSGLAEFLRDNSGKFLRSKVSVIGELPGIRECRLQASPIRQRPLRMPPLPRTGLGSDFFCTAWFPAPPSTASFLPSASPPFPWGWMFRLSRLCLLTSASCFSSWVKPPFLRRALSEPVQVRLVDSFTKTKTHSVFEILLDASK